MRPIAKSMAYDEGLAERVRDLLAQEPVIERKMFGGIAWMYKGHMLVGIIGDELMVRVGTDQEALALKKEGARPMDFTGRPMKGYVFVAPDGIEEEANLEEWIGMAKRFVGTLPPK